MKPIVSIIMGSTSDLPVMEKAMDFLDEMEIPFEVNALSAHRTPQAVELFAREAKAKGIKVIIAAAGMAAALPGVIAASTTIPVIGVPIKGMLDGLDAMLSIIQMPPGISEWCPQRRHIGSRDTCPHRRKHRCQGGGIQGRFRRQDRKGQPTVERSEKIQIQDQLK